jgi:hypothetical protein
VTPPSGSLLPPGQTFVSATARNQYGLTASCTFTVNVVDTTPPVVQCPASIVQPNDAGLSSALVSFAFSATDLGTLSVSRATPPSPSVFPIGVTSVLVFAMDSAGNTAQCSFTVTVFNAQAPVWHAPPPNITLPTLPGANYSIVYYPPFSTFRVTDLVGVTNLTFAHPNGSRFDFGVTPDAAVAWNAAGKSASAPFWVKIVDTEPPKVDCASQPHLTANVPWGSTSVVVFFPTPAATDNVAVASLTVTPPSGSVFQYGKQHYTVKAVDTSGNSYSCDVPLTVLDTEPPHLACPRCLDRRSGVSRQFRPTRATWPAFCPC